ncbi:WhiB family transcriptional regulator [Kitasatospora purpeofusca]|uniref:WhiB family transcriptional regulator n=1 Tax=Kitasatospora purpeofusca TaxID=67352 RepID=UPI0022508D6F|nr:WhiB family transcriptional regulator [Kitasatospora purpeofusca]MCX4686942.1 WhiB family transcriptional regulator [Kitasatospora purpeofusca]
MTQLHSLLGRPATRTPHLTARPAITVLAEIRPAADGDLHGAACKGADTDLFYTEIDEDAEDIETARAAVEWAERRAKMICAGCPVKSLCLADALERKEPAGIFGGLNERERGALLRRSARSRVAAGGGRS